MEWKIICRQIVVRAICAHIITLFFRRPETARFIEYPWIVFIYFRYCVPTLYFSTWALISHCKGKRIVIRINVKIPWPIQVFLSFCRAQTMTSKSRSFVIRFSFHSLRILEIILTGLVAWTSEWFPYQTPR